ncbi:HAD-IA family hydrolase [Aurantimonas sp. Leaf443]|uniref:HAD-IA family hydrolase n=1 Tax=Aurantimonas sp. Leaf443 TaxID=1736378 RepID=UPI0006F830C7|nr:HAD-IA family hydrolase [Aurantimonas sp. Leaf443]KQT83543.1 HAD family hydrolase [Aurantimonas sp. Leaf443]
MRAVLFDCDGTIADSCGLICETMRRTFVSRGLSDPGDAATRAIIGLSLGDAMARLHPAADAAGIAMLVEGYRETFRGTRDDPAFRESLFPGMKDLVVRLGRRPDVLVGMVTGKSRRGVASICAAHGMDGLFLSVRTADDCPSKPHPAMVEECCAELGVHPSECVVVGDAIFDMQMAVHAGATGIGVTWGTNPAEPLVAAGASDVACDVDHLAALIEAWLEGRHARSRHSARDGDADWQGDAA